MDAIERAAFISVGRACGLAWLGIFCIAFSFSFELRLAAFAAGILCLGAALILSAYGWRARTRPYVRTELWLILPEQHRPQPEFAQLVIGQVLRQIYLRFSYQAAVVALVALTFSLFLRAIGVSKPPGSYVGAGSGAGTSLLVGIGDGLPFANPAISLYP